MKSQTSIVWRGMRQLNQRIATQVFGHGRGPSGVVLLLTTIGRKSGQPRVTPLQYEEAQGVIYVAAARGPQDDWFRNIQANPHVKVQIADRVWEGSAEPITDPTRIADFLQLRLKRHPIMMRAMLAAEGQWRCGRAELERFAVRKALVAISPLKKELNES
ncbi:MAG TPA: nitroreductase family deazaflavin-dependent oxidoreductase [Anaerolineae bacterium]|nr:nitroreductase family deazaflavin-dependent oxidoreductase [Anaerolineae bacterium]